MKHFSIFLATAFGLTFLANAQVAECKKVAKSIVQEAKGKTSEELTKLVSEKVKSSPKCSCEVMKGAIKGAKANPTVVAGLVDAAIQAAPDYIDVIMACSIAAAPDAFDEISAIGEKYGKSPNPLDFPGIIGVDPAGQYTFVPDTPVFVNPPQVTFVDP